MQWSLFVLILMGQCSVFVCHLYEYHFVKENKTWEEAQAYCRENYTDLATLFDMTDMKRLCDSTNNQDEAWIGLYNVTDIDQEWYWSLPGVDFNDSEKNWHPKEPNDKANNPENCVLMVNCKWKDFPCSDESKFICFNETNPSNETFQLINTMMTWPEAQSYCREHHTDLISGRSQLEKFKESDENLWIGLFTDAWRWSDNSSFSFRYWDLELFKDEESGKKCAMTVLNGKWGKWSSDECNKTKPFFCYDDKMILINESKTWEDALYYCRENHRDLVSITNLGEQRWVQERAKKANSPYVWLGLHYTCTLDFWFWVSDEVVSYKNWVSDGQTDDCDMSGAMDSGGQHKWFKKNDSEEFNFICSCC